MVAEWIDGGKITVKWQTQMKRVPRSGRLSLSMVLLLPQVSSSCQYFPLAHLLSQALLSPQINLASLCFGPTSFIPLLCLRPMLLVFSSISVQLFFLQNPQFQLFSQSLRCPIPFLHYSCLSATLWIWQFYLCIKALQTFPLIACLNT